MLKSELHRVYLADKNKYFKNKSSLAHENRINNGFYENSYFLEN